MDQASEQSRSFHEAKEVRDLLRLTRELLQLTEKSAESNHNCPYADLHMTKDLEQDEILLFTAKKNAAPLNAAKDALRLELV